MKNSVRKAVRGTRFDLVRIQLTRIAPAAQESTKSTLQIFVMEMTSSFSFMKEVLTERQLRQRLVEQGLKHAGKFSSEKAAREITRSLP